MAKSDTKSKDKAPKLAPAVAGGGATPTIGWKIEQPEYDARVVTVRAEMERRGMDALVLFYPTRMAYVSGFFHLSTERPMAIVVTLEGGLGALIPQLEQEHIQRSPGVDRVEIYKEYPSGGGKHPMRHLADLLTRMGVNAAGKTIGYDNDGYGDINGYTGPRLTEIVADGVEAVYARDLVDVIRHIKSPAEISFMREACVWGNLAHRLMQQGIALGRTEMDIFNEASTEASRMMVAALGPSYQPLGHGAGHPAYAMFHAGANTSLPHGFSNAVGLRRGDILVSGACSYIAGLESELERTMIVGDPTPEFEKYFAILVELQQVGFDALRPGRTLAETEGDVARAYEELGVAHMQRHHTGHGMGMEGHESPFIDLGDETVIQENMIFSVEPGLYVPGLGGFRHSDTVVIRSFGSEIFSDYPRDLESMIIHV